MKSYNQQFKENISYFKTSKNTISLNNRFHILQPLISNKHTSPNIKFLIYKILLKLIWKLVNSYGEVQKE